MSESDHSSTHMSLINSLFSHADDVDVGLTFLEKYKPLLLGVARSRGVRIEDAEDIAQEALKKMLAGFHHFQRERKGSFRAWLRSIAHSASVDWFRNQPKLEVQLAEEIAQEVPRALAYEYQTDVMDAAIRKVKLEINPRTWAMFERTRIEKEPGKQVADEMGLSVLTVYNGAKRVANRLRELYELFDKMSQE